MAKSPYSSNFELECDEAQRKAEKFFKTLLKHAHTLPRWKVFMKAPAALAASYAIFTLMDGPGMKEEGAMLVMLSTTRKLFEAEIEKERGKRKKHA